MGLLNWLKNNDPEDALELKPNQRKLPSTGKPCKEKSKWVPHKGDALDPWGTGIRDMKKAGTYPDD